MSGRGTSLLRVRELRVTYPRRGRRAAVDAVAGVSFDVQRGRTLGLVGESGSGKSSVGAAILGLTPVTSGTIEYDGVDITHATRTERRALARRIQVVFQDPFSSMNPARTVGDSITEALRYNMGLGPIETRSRLVRVLDDVGLSVTAASRYPRQFSGGQRQRLAIARALITDPEFIVCDEPTSALDLSVQAQILNLLAELKEARGLGYLFITHNLSVVKYIGDDIAVLRGGELIEKGTTRQVLESPRETYTRALVMAAPVPDPAAQRARRAELRALLDASAQPSIAD